MKNKKFKWVLFDLYDTLIIVREFHRAMIEKKIAWNVFNEFGIKTDRQKFYETQYEIKEQLVSPIEKRPELGVLEQEISKKLGNNITLDQAKKIHYQIHEKSKKHVKLAVGAKSILIWLKQNDINRCLISNGHTKDIIKDLEREGLKEFFDEIITSEDCSATKAENTPFKLFLGRHPEIKPEECLMIGDSLSQDTYSQKIGIPAAIFEFKLSESNISRINELKKEGLMPKYRINELKDIKDIILKG